MSIISNLLGKNQNISQTEADQINQFDLAFRKKTEYERLMGTMIRVIFLFCAGILYVIPFQMDEVRDLRLYFLVNVALFMVIMIDTAQMLGIMEKQNRISLFEKLKYTPIDPEVFYRDRMFRMSQHVHKIMLVLSMLQIASATIFRMLSWQTILYLALVWGSLLGSGYLQVKSAYRAVKG